MPHSPHSSLAVVVVSSGSVFLGTGLLRFFALQVLFKGFSRDAILPANSQRFYLLSAYQTSHGPHCCSQVRRHFANGPHVSKFSLHCCDLS